MLGSTFAIPQIFPRNKTTGVGTSTGWSLTTVLLFMARIASFALTDGLTTFSRLPLRVGSLS